MGNELANAPFAGRQREVGFLAVDAGEHHGQQLRAAAKSFQRFSQAAHSFLDGSRRPDLIDQFVLSGAQGHAGFWLEPANSCSIGNEKSRSSVNPSAALRYGGLHSYALR